MIKTVTQKYRISHITITLVCLIGLTLGLSVACTTSSPAPLQQVRLYTRTPTPTATPVTPTPTLSVQAHYQQGLSQQIAWDLEAALAHFDAALDLDPELAPVYVNRAEIYRLLGRYDEAAADIETALTLDPELAEAWRQKALLDRTESAWEEALTAVSRLIKLRPDDAAAYAARAQIYTEGFGKIRMALADYNRAIARDASFDKATLVERWHILATLERWEEALLVGHKMFTSGSENPLRYYYRAWSLIQLGRLDEAIQMLFFGLERYPDYPVALYYALGIAYYERQAWPEAIQTLDVALIQSGAPLSNRYQEYAAWRQLDITTADILGPMGVAYLELEQCETGAAIVERAVAEDTSAENWTWALERVQDCYLTLTPTPTPQEAQTP
jgi:tetratricopeptide (TPR) repeat protein